MQIIIKLNETFTGQKKKRRIMVDAAYRQRL